MTDLSRFIDEVAERTPAPGGGAVAAIAVSLAAGLVAMTARYSADSVADSELLANRADALRLRAVQLADADSRAYGKVIAAGVAARGDRPTSRECEAVGLQDALREASEVPTETAELGAQAAELAGRLLVEGNRRLRGDCATGLLLAEAATRAAARLVSINVAAAGSGADLVDRAERSVDRARRSAAALSE